MTPGPRIDAVWRVARNELFDSIRSRRVMVLGLLYVAGSAAATALFIGVLQKIERQLAESLGLAVAANTGSVTATLWKSDAFRHMATGLAGDKALAERLLDIPPLGLFYGWLSFAFAPALVMLTSAARISEEVWSGSVRFALFRVSRLEWVLGKFAGQAGQLVLALLLSAVAAWLTGLVRMHAFESAATAQAMLSFALKAGLYAMAFLGLATAISQFCTTPNIALALGFFALIVLQVLTAVSHYLTTNFAAPGWRRVWDTVNTLTPGGHRMDLWWGDAAHAVPATVFLLALSLCYLFAGYAAFSRRDL
jgi:ABC-type transport system involved in multi-copper enzyme maturation permease subunit